MDRFKGKKILFISPKFFGYEKAIFNKLSEVCERVDYIDDRPENSVIIKAILRIHHNLLYYKLIKYYNTQFEKIKNNTYDYVFILNPEGMLPKIVERFRNHFKQAIFILYMWDSIKNRKHTPNVLEFFDRKFSFDSNDTISFKEVKFRALFYTDDYKTSELLNKNVNANQYDLAFIGTGHSDRLFIINKIISTLGSAYTSYVFLYINSKKYFWFRKATEKQFFKSAKLNNFNFKPISSKEIINVFKKSKAILDINHPKQFGLTIRTLEVLALQKKIITTNSTIKSYDFYNANNILILDRENPVIDKEFFQKSFIPTPPSILYKYSLEGWLLEIFFQN